MSVVQGRRVGHPRPQDVKVKDVFGVTSPMAGGYDTAGIQAIQDPYTPAMITPGSVGITDPGASLSFLFTADQGGIENPTPQDNVIAAMAQRLPGPAFLFIGGDIVYFNGDPAQWPLQFYQPFESFPLPIIATAGNHDGDPTDGVPGAGIASFLANMCTPAPTLPPGDPQDEFGRDTQTLPSHDFGIEFEAVTILAVWTNVPSGGHLFPQQVEWLTSAVQAASASKPLILIEHHPPYSVSASGGSSPKLNAIFDGIWQQTGRWPDLILSGHVHDFQAFTRTISGVDPSTVSPTPAPTVVKYVVCGNGGYRNLHAIASDYAPGMSVADGIVCDYADGSNWGFIEFTVSQTTSNPDGYRVSGEYVQVGKDGTVTPSAYTWSC